MGGTHEKEGYTVLSTEPTPPAYPQAQRDVEKGAPPSQQVYGTFLNKPKSDFDNEKSQVVKERRLLNNVWWALGVSLMVVGTIAVYAFVIVAAAL